MLIVVALIACSTPAPSSALVNTPALDDFRKIEHATLQTFNDALGRQRANAIDELALADVIDRDVLPPWRELRTRIASATIPPADRDLFITLGRYVAERQTSWEAYSAALRSHDDASAQPHYATYHQQNVAATNDAKSLGKAFRSLP
ncbi:MAG: hypothetical protein ABI591_16170 [Kofleriaceae bacterium]